GVRDDAVPGGDARALLAAGGRLGGGRRRGGGHRRGGCVLRFVGALLGGRLGLLVTHKPVLSGSMACLPRSAGLADSHRGSTVATRVVLRNTSNTSLRSEEHTSEL